MTTIPECSHRWEAIPPSSAVALGERGPLGCRRPRPMRCVLCSRHVIGDCKSTRRSRCEYCATRYRRRVMRVAASGIERRDAVCSDRLYMITLTAPGEREHWLPGGRVRCRCTPMGGVDLRVWNGRAAKQFNRWKQQLEREVGCKIEHFRATEVQGRGALHYHVPVRFSASVKLPIAMIRRLAMNYGFGHSVDVQEIGAKGPAGYCAKYVSKSADERELVPFVHHKTGQIGPGRWRTWSSSRGWGQSMADVKAAQHEWSRLRREATEAGPSTRHETRVGAVADGALDTNERNYTSADDRLHVLPDFGVCGAM